MRLMQSRLLSHYLQYSAYTHPGAYAEHLRLQVPDDVREFGKLVRAQTIHSMVLVNGNTGSNSDLRYGDMTKVPWYRQREDDVFPTVSAMIAELFRRDARGFVIDRAEENRLVVTCRFVSLLTASILKSKSIPARVRSGFAPYFDVENLPQNTSVDHWIVEYWSTSENRWVLLDVDGSLEPNLTFDPYDVPRDVFDFPADAWLDVRQGRINGDHFYNAGGHSGLQAIAWELMYDFHCLMNNEVIYWHVARIAHIRNFPHLTNAQLKEIDNLALLMTNIDENFESLQRIWNNKKDFRLLAGGLL